MIQVPIANRLGIEPVIFQGVVFVKYSIEALGLGSYQLRPFQHFDQKVQVPAKEYLSMCLFHNLLKYTEKQRPRVLCQFLFLVNEVCARGADIKN